MDGIIQKVIQEYINMEINMQKKGYDSVFRNNKELLNKLQQELIEEIKKSHNNGGCDITCGNTKECRFIEELIGDNE